MESACVRHTDMPGTSKLYSDFLYHPERVTAFYPSLPARLADGLTVDFPDARRQAMAAALAEINPGSALLDQFAQPGTAVVVTGQQVGLFGGPLYTVFKALTAVQLARQLTAQGTPAVPVFWVATEDHDFEEINHTWTLDGDRKPLKLTAQGDHQPQQPVGPVHITELPEISDEMVRRHYRVGATFGEAFIGLVRELLGDHEVLFLDPLRPSIRQIAAPFLAAAAARSNELNELVIARGKELTAAGYHAQVLFDGKGSSLFFALEGGRRKQLKAADVTSFAGAPEQLSPNALLRPVMQDYLLPTVAMIGGPAEIAYLAQSSVLYEALLGRQPVAVPRAGFTLLDSRAAKLMDRYQLRLPDLMQPEATVREQIAAHLAPPALQQTFTDAAAQLQTTLDRVEHALGGFDRTLVDAFATSRRKIAHQLAKSQAKAARELMRRSEREQADSSYLINEIFPHRHLQERFYSILPFLAAHGPDLVGRAYDNIHVDCFDHHVLAL
ncbi:MAG: bacillithiol biosynthesis BshC [Acidobacteria bacterium]|nr:bacillithiol biosynthesis BshC [Acidobacteriota bacterium]